MTEAAPQNPSEDVLAYVMRGIAAYKRRWPDLAEKSGVSYSWISKVSSGQRGVSNVGLRTVERVAAALRADGFQ